MSSSVSGNCLADVNIIAAGLAAACAVDDESVCDVDSVEDGDVTSPGVADVPESNDDVELTSAVAVDCSSIDVLTVVASVACIASVAFIASVPVIASVAAFDTVGDEVDGAGTLSVVVTFSLGTGIDVSSDKGPFLSTNKKLNAISLFSRSGSNPNPADSTCSMIMILVS